MANITFLTAFAEQSNKDNTTSTLKDNVGKSTNNNFSFYDHFASLDNPDLAKTLTSYYDEQKKKKQQVIDHGLSSGMSWEDISNQTGIPLQEVQDYSQQTRPNYGVKPQQNLAQKAGKEVSTLWNSAVQSTAKNIETKGVASGVGQTVGTLADQVPGVKPLRTEVAQQFRNLSQPTPQQGQSMADYIAKGQDNIKTGKVSKEAAAFVNSDATKGVGPQGTFQLWKTLAENPNVDVKTLQSITQADKKHQTDQIKKGVGTLAALESNFIGAGEIGGASKGTQVAAKVLGSGAAFGVGNAGSSLAENPDISGKDLLKSAGTGFAAGVVLGGAGATAGALYRKLSNGKVMNKVTGEITDEASLANETKLLTANSTQPEARQLVPGNVNDPRNLASTTTNPRMTAGDNPGTLAQDIQPLTRADQPKSADIQKLAQVEAKIAEAQQTGNITAEEARSLMQQRQQLIENIQTPHANALDSIDQQLSTATTKQDVKALNQEKQFVEQQAERDLKSQESATILDSSNQKVSGQAQSTEARAISEGLGGPIADKATYGATNWDYQANRAVDIMNNDYARAQRIALGQEAPPADVLVNAVYKGVESRAIKEGDTKLIRQLAQAPTASLTSRAAQELGVLGAKDLESPVTALQAITKARKASGLNIPAVVTEEETKQVTSLAKKVADSKAALISGSGDRMAYGRARIEYDNYVNGLVEQAKKGGLKEALRHPGDTALNVAGATKSLRATLDMSGLLRQGFKTLLTHPGTWAKNSAKSFVAAAKAFGGKQVMDEVAADLVSRPNALNGLYKKMGLDVMGITEEAFPSAFPEKIPIFRRFYNASEAGYTAFLQQSRADLADMYLKVAAKSGVDLTSQTELKSIGKLVNSLTSRGDLGRLESSAKVLNNVFFSPRFLKSNIDVLTAHQFQRGVTPFVRKQAAINLLKIAVGTATILKLADEMRPGSVEWDPRSSDYGKIRIGDTRYDVTGGMGQLVTLGSRIITNETKSSTTGEVKKLNTGEYGGQTTADVVLDFFSNKTAPATQVILQHLKGQDFNGNPPTLKSDIANLTVPLIITNYQELKNNPKAGPLVASMIAEGLGISTNTYSPTTNWTRTQSKQLQQFRSKVGQDKFKQANDTFNQDFNKWFDQIKTSDSYHRLSPDDRQKLITAKRSALETDVLKKYNFEYKRPQKNDQTNKLINDLKNL